MYGGWSEWQGWEKCSESHRTGASKARKIWNKHFIFCIFEWINQCTVVGVIGRVGKNALNHTEHQPVRQEKFKINILFPAYLNGSTS